MDSRRNARRAQRRRARGRRAPIGPRRPADHCGYGQSLLDCRLRGPRRPGRPGRIRRVRGRRRQRRAVGRDRPAAPPARHARRDAVRSGAAAACPTCAPIRGFGWWPAAHPVLRAIPRACRFSSVATVWTAPRFSARSILANPRGRTEFSDDDERLLGVLAAHAAIALTNARLFEQGRELTLVQERQRIARELHDAVAQTLFSLRLTAQAAAALVRRDPDRAATELDTVADLAASGRRRAADRSSRSCARAELSHAGLVETLRDRVALLDRVHAASVTFEVTSDVDPACDLPHRRPRRRCCGWPRRRCTTRFGTRGRSTSRSRSRCTVDGADPGDRRRRQRVRYRRCASGSTNRLGLASMRERSRVRTRQSHRHVDDRGGHDGRGWRCPRWVSPAIRVLIADDHAVVRRGLRTFLDYRTTSRWSARRPTVTSASPRPPTCRRT